jgi:polyvinyl alcohol dehydrogenase (cytochrome)
LIVGAKSGIAYGLDPANQGKIVWENRIGSGGPQVGIMWGSAADDKLAYVAVSDWDPGKPETGGGMFGLEIATGKKVWSTPAPKPGCLGTPGCSAAQLGPVSAIAGVVFAGSLDGHLRAYDSTSGVIIWDVDTLPQIPTVNGITAHGGSMNGSGPTIAGGMLFSLLSPSDHAREFAARIKRRRQMNSAQAVAWTIPSRRRFGSRDSRFPRP